MYVVIMAGGAGTRFWPLSRRHRPKQLLSLFGDRPMITETVARFSGVVPPERILVVTSEALLDAIREALPELPPENLLAEPVGRNTAPCIGLAAIEVLRRTQDASSIVAVFPADHYIRDSRRFLAAVDTAVETARSGAIVTLGVEPTKPETGYGYIQHGAVEADGTARVDAFVEKPNRETALRYLQDGNYVWNAGIFAFRIDVLLDEFARQLPVLRQQLDEVSVALTNHDDVALREVFERIESVSIDYGIMEGAANVRVVPTYFGWSDVGAWDALSEVAETDQHGNVAIGDVVAIDCRGCVLVGHDHRVLAAVGLSHVVVVDSEDAVLVAPRDRVQEVRAIVDSLKNRSGTLI